MKTHFTMKTCLIKRTILIRACLIICCILVLNGCNKRKDIEQVHITNINCQPKCRAIAIRTNDSAGISNVYISGLIYRGPYNSILLGGKGYGKPSLPDRINNVHVMNVMGDGNSLVLIEEAVAYCSFLNGMYSGEGEIIKYNLDKNETRNIISQNLIKISN